MSDNVIDWSKYGLGKPRVKPEAEIVYFGKDGRMHIRAEFPADMLDQVVEQIRRQLDYWKESPQ
jgi:hypothetical protein